MGHPVRFVRALLAGGALVALLQMPTGVRAVDLQGQTWFASPPWKVDFRNYYTYVMQTGGEYYFTVTLPEGAGVGLGGLALQQTRGVDRQFPLAAERTRAFFGLPRREGAAIPVEASFDNIKRLFNIRFPQPPQPGQTITVALRPWFNPSQADTYMFAVQALPAGPNPVPAPLGFATMPIYNAFPL
ncbi:MAG: DUF2808 domain-containing protein [Vulcanococcus sp.]